MSNNIYYKGNPFTRNDFIPDSAKKNRKIKNYMVELPQGNDYFSSSRKKQYVNLHQHSEIKDSNLLILDHEKHFSHNNLEVSDIEGAKPSTIMSDALRNRLKGKNYRKNFVVREKNSSVSYLNDKQLNQKLEVETNLLFQKRKSEEKKYLNFHFQTKNLKTEPSEDVYREYRDHGNEYGRLITEGVQTWEEEDRNQRKQRGQNQNYQSHFHYQKQPVTPGPKVKFQDSIERELASQERLKQIAHEDGNVVGSNLMSSNSSPQRVMMRDQRVNSLNPSTKKIRIEEDNDHNKKSNGKDPSPNSRSPEQIRQLWHGDSRRIRLIPLAQIRRNNPTYLSQFSNNPES